MKLTYLVLGQPNSLFPDKCQKIYPRNHTLMAIIHNSHSRLRINKTDIDMEFLAFLKLYVMPAYLISVHTALVLWLMMVEALVLRPLHYRLNC